MTDLSGVVQNMAYDLGDGLRRRLVNYAEEGDEPSMWWLYVYTGWAPDGRRFDGQVPMTPEFVGDQGPDRVRAMVIEEWQAALDQALAEENS